MDDDLARVGARVEQTLRRAEEKLERYGGTREARAATARVARRTARDVGTRLKRSVAAMSVTGIGIAGVGFASAAIGGIDALIAAAIAVPAAGAIGALLPTRRAPEPARFTETPLARLASDAEEWLSRRRRDLPRAACAPADQVAGRLSEIQPGLAARAPGDADAVEARRLIADHLPRLVNAYLAVPTAHRAPEVERELVDGLGIIAGELARLSQSLAADKLVALKIEGRFLEARYKEGEGA